MAIALDTSTVSTAQTASPITWNHTCTGTNLLLVVSVHLWTSGATAPAATAVTYNGVSMVKADNVVTQTTSNRVETSIWLLAAPTTGTNQVSVTCTNITNGEGISASYTGAQQSSYPDAVVGKYSANGTGAKTLVVVPNTSQAWTYTAFTAGDSTIQPGLTTATHTQRQNQNNGTRSVGASEDSNGVINASVTMGFTITGTGAAGTQAAGLGIAFAPFITPHNLGFTQNRLRPHAFSPGLAR